MPARRRGRVNVPSMAVKVWTASKSPRLRAMTSALPTGRAALVTLPRTARKGGSGTSGRAVPAIMTMAVAKAIARYRRMLLPIVSREFTTRGKRRSVTGMFQSDARNQTQPLVPDPVHPKQIRLRPRVNRRPHQNHEPVARPHDVLLQEKLVDPVDDLLVKIARVLQDVRLHAPQ